MYVLDKKLKIANVYLSFDGEVTYLGPLRFTTVVRLGGCNLRCWKDSGFCDAPETLDLNYPYGELTLAEIVSKVEANAPCYRVLITGGEPLLQKNVYDLALYLHTTLNRVVTLETSGSISMDLCRLASFSAVIADLKPPSTQMHKMMKPDLFHVLRKCDFIKCVVEDEDDYRWCLDYLREVSPCAQIAMGPRHGYLEPRKIVEWLIRDRRTDVILNVQAHKYIYPELSPLPLESLDLITPELRHQLLQNEV